MAVFAVRDGSHLWEAAAVLGAAAVVVLAVSLWLGWASGVAWTLALLAAEYALAVSLREGDAGVDAAAPFYAAGLLLTAELAYWSIELRVPGRVDVGLTLRRVATLAGVVLASVAVGTVVVSATAVPLGSALLWDAVGAAAAVATLAILARLARRA